MELKIDSDAIAKAVNDSATKALTQALGGWEMQKAVAEIVTTEVAKGAVADAVEGAAPEPAGLDAGVALREYSEIESERFALDAQADETVNTGPRTPKAMLTCDAAALFINFGTTKGCTRFFPSA